jgi:hypothetical protein
VRKTFCGRPIARLPSPAVRSRVYLWWVAAAACVLAVVPVASSSAAGSTRQKVISTPSTIPLATAFTDPNFEGPQQATAFPMARAAGATYVRLNVAWSAIAPATPPDGFVAADPTSPGYAWSSMDTILGEAEAAGLTPILDITSPPTWAYATQPQDGNGGTPIISDLGDFATALATHYNGVTTGAPAEHIFQIWNEPNLSINLDPVSASTYRNMVNAAADAIHAVDPSNIVVAGGLDPFGRKKPKWYSVPPLTFMRSLLCLSKGAHPHRTCSADVHFDVWSHHPYTYGGPFSSVRQPGDVSLGKLPSMRKLLQAGVKQHHVVSSGPVPFWVTEFGWNTNPPRSHAASLGLASRWTSEALHQMWLSGVSLVTWFLLQDFRSPTANGTGVYFYSPSLQDARAKPVLRAFQFPFTAYLKKKKVSVWGRVETSDQQVVSIERRRGKSGAWRRVARVRSNQYGIFKATLRLKATTKDWLRASVEVEGSDPASSLAFSLKQPKNPPPG